MKGKDGKLSKKRKRRSPASAHSASCKGPIDIKLGLCDKAVQSRFPGLKFPLHEGAGGKPPPKRLTKFRNKASST
ncbi:hypothetical protein NDU88_006468 [Pleurodeles waltl]|uniref:Uncharacterized protein n=1 Tax=Pleurodeles waltl TaxID=8319 RepID=A0AAV7WEE5_PLEWA|nr:hypothetical protein NDU88_006468 [Pleurodeles waltl]